MRKGWSFSDPTGIEQVRCHFVQVPNLTSAVQCVEEGWMDKMKEQNTEGCRLSGRVRVNKVDIQLSHAMRVPLIWRFRSSATCTSVPESPSRTI